MIRYNYIPTYEQPLVEKGKTTRPWYAMFQGLYKGVPTADVVPVTVTSSPMTYEAPQGGTLWISAGTVTSITISRDGNTFYPTGVLAGPFPLSQADQLRFAYSMGPPTVTWFPK